LKPFNVENIEPAALRVNHHKLEDITHQTKYGKDTYLDPNIVIIDIENWLANDNSSTEQRVLVGANTGFDKGMLDHLWAKCNSSDTFPFGRRYIDIQQIEFFINLSEDKMLDSYSLSSIIKKYGVRNDKSHTAAADTLAAKEVFEKQVEFFKSVLIKSV
jgi:DNA polymerase III alpha subunit (gram-positive type)